MVWFGVWKWQTSFNAKRSHTPYDLFDIPPPNTSRHSSMVRSWDLAAKINVQKEYICAWDLSTKFQKRSIYGVNLNLGSWKTCIRDRVMVWFRVWKWQTSLTTDDLMQSMICLTLQRQIHPDITMMARIWNLAAKYKNPQRYGFLESEHKFTSRSRLRNPKSWMFKNTQYSVKNRRLPRHGSVWDSSTNFTHGKRICRSGTWYFKPWQNCSHGLLRNYRFKSSTWKAHSVGLELNKFTMKSIITVWHSNITNTITMMCCRSGTWYWTN